MLSEPLGQHCTGLLHVQCCPKTIKTTLNRIFSRASLSRASRKPLHRVFTCAITCAMLTKSAETYFRWKITYTMLSWSAWANIVQENYLYNVGPQSTNKFAQKNNLQCCLEISGPILHKEITCEMFALA